LVNETVGKKSRPESIGVLASALPMERVDSMEVDMTTTPVVTKSAAVLPRERLVISIEGNIGIGKSTLLSHLKARWKEDPTVAFVGEPVELWEQHGLLEAMYANTISRSSFQLMAVTSRYGTLAQALATDASLIITERSVHSDRACFARVNLQSPCDQAAYAATHEALCASLPDGVRYGMIYLDAPLGMLNERIAKRGRSAEDADTEEGSGVPDDYLTALGQAHEDYFKSYDSESKRRIDATVSASEVAQQVFGAIAEIEALAPPTCISPASVMML
jgi:deoxyadenosine/deoxycytidine kinase